VLEHAAVDGGAHAGGHFFIGGPDVAQEYGLAVGALAPGGGCGSVSFTPVVNTEDADKIGWFEVEEDPPLADPQAQSTGTVLDGLHVASKRAKTSSWQLP
jgi:hypothetical protein